MRVGSTYYWWENTGKAEVEDWVRLSIRDWAMLWAATLVGGGEELNLRLFLIRKDPSNQAEVVIGGSLIGERPPARPTPTHSGVIKWLCTPWGQDRAEITNSRFRLHFHPVFFSYFDTFLHFLGCKYKNEGFHAILVEFPAPSDRVKGNLLRKPKICCQQSDLVEGEMVWTFPKVL